MLYKVTWEIELDADTPLAAAQEAAEYMRDEGGFDPFFTVRGEDGVESEIDMEAYRDFGTDE
jgi:hypothetical protein